MAGNDDLHKILLNVQSAVNKVENAIKALVGEVEKVKKAIVKNTEEIRDAIHENIEAQAEFKLMEHMMEVKSVKPQIEAEYEQIRMERDELDGQLQRIEERYRRRHGELDETARQRIRNLGSHIFEIDEEQFEEGIEEPFTEQVTSAWHSLRAHNEDVREERNSRVRETTGEVVGAIRDFVDRRESLVESIRDHRIDADEVPVSGGRVEPLQVPYYVVEYEVDGVAQREVVVPSQATTDGGTEWCPVSLSPLPGAEELVGNATRSHSTGSKDWLTEDDLLAVLDEYGESTPLGASYVDAVAETTPDDGLVPVRIAGGED